MNRLAYLLVLLVALVMAGCTSHAPSASKFMNVKPHSLSVGFGGTVVSGDYYDYVVQRDDDGRYVRKDNSLINTL